MDLVAALKSIPVDLGQGNKRFVTKGKLIALSYVPRDGAGRRLLDIGCREGAQSEMFRRMGYEVTSVDIDGIYDHCQIVDCNNRLPFEDAQFDVIWSSEVIEHLIDPYFAASELRRVARPGGRLVLTTPNSFAVYFCVLAALGLTPQKIQRRDHLHFFDFLQLQRIFPRAEVVGFLPFTFLRPRIFRGVGALSPTFVVIEDKMHLNANMDEVTKVA